MGVAARLDGFQRRHNWLGFPLGVIYKFGDDQGGYLAALITYYGFVSLFPLLLLFVSVLGFTLHGDPTLQTKLLGSALQQLPVVGSQLQENVSSAHGSVPAVVIGLLGAIYGGLGVSVAIESGLNRVWAVPRYQRPDPFVSRLRGLVLFVLLGALALVTTGLSAVGSAADSFGAQLGVGVRVAAVAVAVVVNVGVFLLVFLVLTAREIRFADLAPGAVTAAVLWQVLQGLGTFYVGHELRGSSQTYGVFGLVLGLLAWIYLLALILVLSAEINVVRARRLWPRNLLSPFVDDVVLTAADRDAFRSYARSERYKPFQRVQTTFDGQPDPPEEAG